MKNVRPNRTRPASRNPLRTTLEHPGLLQTYYTEVKTGAAERELKRIKHEQSNKKSLLTTSVSSNINSTIVPRGRAHGLLGREYGVRVSGSDLLTLGA